MVSGKDRYETSRNLLRRAEAVLAGGVGSDFRRYEKPCPLYFSHGRGAYLWDVDGNRYADFVLGQGPLLLGHCHPVWVKALTDQLHQGQMYAGQSELEIALSETLKEKIPGAELMRYGSSSSEMVQLALRVARAHTGRSRWVKMEGHYHGWFDGFLASVHPSPSEAGDFERPEVVLHSSGQNPRVRDEILIGHFNDLPHLERVFRDHAGEIAAVLLEPVMCNSGFMLPKEGYLEGVQAVCRRHEALLIFDETISGFRIAAGGATERFGVTPDMAVYGKGLGGGVPISCLAGSEKVMKTVSDSSVFHAGTFNTNLLALRGALATLNVLSTENGRIYKVWDDLGKKLRSGLRELARIHRVNLLVKGIGQITYTGFGDDTELETYRNCWRLDDRRLETWSTRLKAHGIRIIPRGIWYLSTAHGHEEIDAALAAADDVLGEISREMAGAQ